MSETITLILIGAISVGAIFLFLTVGTKKTLNPEFNSFDRKSNDKSTSDPAPNSGANKKKKGKKNEAEKAAKNNSQQQKQPPQPSNSVPAKKSDKENSKADSAEKVTPKIDSSNKNEVKEGKKIETKSDKKNLSKPEPKNSSNDKSSKDPKINEGLYYSKESIENFESFEDFKAADSSDGWTEVDAGKKNKRAVKPISISPTVSSSKMVDSTSIPSNESEKSFVDSIKDLSLSNTEPKTQVIIETPTIQADSLTKNQTNAVETPVVIITPPPPVVPAVEVFKKEVKIDPKKIGFVIGPKGATLKSIEAASECEILMPKTDKDSTSLATVIVSGSQLGVNKVYFILIFFIKYSLSNHLFKNIIIIIIIIIMMYDRLLKRLTTSQPKDILP